MGELYAAVDSTALAVSHLQAALRVDANYAPAVALLSKILYDTGYYEEGVAMLEDFVDRNADAPDALRAALALHLEALGEIEQAQSVLDLCSGSSKEARAARTFVYLMGTETPPVLETAEQAVKDNPKSAANRNNYGIALLHAGRPDEARKEFLKALELNDKLPGAFYNMAIVEAFYFFNEEKGREWFQRYRQYASDDPDDLATQLSTDLSRLLKTEATDEKANSD
jgi:tetratricopeptide (TPR) repeat protein